MNARIFRLEVNRDPRLTEIALGVAAAISAEGDDEASLPRSPGIRRIVLIRVTASTQNPKTVLFRKED
jgi:hypothetical protein